MRPSPLRDRAGNSARRSFVAIRKQAEQDVAVEPIVALARPSARPRSIATRNGSISLPYCTPEGQAVSQARQSRHSSRCPRTRSFSSSLPSVTARIR